MLHYIKKRVNKNVNHITEYISKEMQKIYTENYETSMEYQLYHQYFRWTSRIRTLAFQAVTGSLSSRVCRVVMSAESTLL